MSVTLSMQAATAALEAQDAGFEVSGELVAQGASLANALLVDDREQPHWQAGFAALGRHDVSSAEIHFRRAYQLDRIQRHQTTLAQRQNVAARAFQRTCNGAVDRVRDLLATLCGLRPTAVRRAR